MKLAHVQTLFSLALYGFTYVSASSAQTNTVQQHMYAMMTLWNSVQRITTTFMYLLHIKAL